MTSQNYFQQQGLYRPGLVPNFGGFGGYTSHTGQRFAFARPMKTAVKMGGWNGMNPSFEEQDSGEIEPEKPPRSAFRTAIRSAQQGIAYLILDNGYDYMLAMQDALDEQKF